MLEKLLDILKIIIEKFFIPALIAIPFTILSVNLLTEKLSFLDSFTLTENYVFQYMIYFLLILAFYTLIKIKIKKREEKYCWNEWDKEFQEDLINQINSYPSNIRNIIKELFNSKNSPVTITADAYEAKNIQDVLYDKVTLSLTNQYNDGHVYLCRLTDDFYKQLLKIHEKKGYISNY